ncbi:MAG: tetratricopeptide repeat protein [Candidatus Omnitrophota bacterium]
MNHPLFTDLRRQVDEAITFDDQPGACRLIAEGLRLAGQQDCPGEILYFRAQAEIIAGRFEAAIGLLEEALLSNPTDGAAYNDIALCRVEMGRLEGVLEIFDQGIAVEPDYATIHHNKGWFLNKIGRLSEALPCLRRAIALEPLRAVTWENIADIYQAQGLLGEAVQAYRMAVLCLGGCGAGIKEQLKAEMEKLEKMLTIIKKEAV